MKSQPRGTDLKTFKASYRERNEGDFPSQLIITLQKEFDTKYGENPHQHAAVYVIGEINGTKVRTLADVTNLQYVRSDGKGKGGLSLTNSMDICRAMDALKYFRDPTIAIMKHTIVSGFATTHSAFDD